MKVWMVHGAFNLDDGKKAWDSVRPYLKEGGATPANFSYGWVGPLTTRRKSREAAKKLVNRVQPEDGLLAFSNGGLVIAYAMEEGLQARNISLIQPALEPGFEFPQKKGVKVYYNPRDFVVSLSVGAFWHEWGRMGRVGPEDPGVRGVDTSRDGAIPATGHFGWRQGKPGQYWSARIAREVITW